MKKFKGVIEYRFKVNGKETNNTFRYNGFFQYLKGLIKAHLKGSDYIFNHKS